MAKSAPKQTLTTAETAAVLGVSPRRVRQISARIGFAWHGSQLMFRAADVRAYKSKRGK